MQPKITCPKCNKQVPVRNYLDHARKHHNKRPAYSTAKTIGILPFITFQQWEFTMAAIVIFGLFFLPSLWYMLKRRNRKALQQQPKKPGKFIPGYGFKSPKK